MPPPPNPQLEEFCRGLHPILVAGDVAAFQRYLSQWEELIGDTAELAQTSEAQQRRTMEALLRRPQQFNLPPWPRTAPAPPLSVQVAPAGPLPAEPPLAVDTGSPTGPPPQSPQRGDGTSIDMVPPAPGAPAIPEQRIGAPGALAYQDAPDSTGSTGDDTGVFQLDMLTGELVPVGSLPQRLPAAAEETPPAKPVRRPRRRRLPPGMQQLVFWRDEGRSGCVSYVDPAP